jgi:hypothetical protein
MNYSKLSSTQLGNRASLRQVSRAGVLMAAVSAALLLAACGGGGDATTPSAAVAAPVAAETPAVDGGPDEKYVLPVLTAAPANLSGSVVCSNQRIGAVTVDNVQVPEGKACRLAGTRVTGSIDVARGGILLAANVNVAGSVQGSEAEHVQVTGINTVVGGNVEVEGGVSATIQGISVRGDVFVQQITGLFIAKNTKISGGFQFKQSTGGGEITGNSIVGNLQCDDNLPPPIVGNNTAKSIEGQCIVSSSGGGTSSSSSSGVITPPLSGNVTCVGLTIGAIRLDSVIVPAGATCSLSGTILNGTIEVGQGASLVATNVNLTGGFIADGATRVSLSGTSLVGAGVSIQRSASVSVNGATITGDLKFDNNTGAVVAANNRISGNTQVMANRGGVTLNGNSMVGVLQCKDNFPAPTGSLNSASLKEDQCLGL